MSEAEREGGGERTLAAVSAEAGGVEREGRHGDAVRQRPRRFDLGRRQTSRKRSRRERLPARGCSRCAQQHGPAVERAVVQHHKGVRTADDRQQAELSRPEHRC
eukprot:scaffold104102_cov57-Phaeocystis_antarctica.AAC.2